jgi:hypothetical protein
MANTNPVPQLPACNLPSFTLPAIPNLLADIIKLLPGWPPTLPTIPVPSFPCPFSEPRL